MPRFNVICHGMMLIVEEQPYCQLLMPEIKEHDFRFGSPQGANCACDTPDGFPAQIPTGNFQMNGIPLPDDPKPFMDSLNPADHLIIHRSLAAVHPGTARIAIDVPTPDEINFFRPVALARPRSVFGQKTPASVAAGIPQRLHDIIVFSYTNVASGTQVTIGDWYNQTVSDSTVNLCLYSQIGRDTPAPPPGDRKPHRTGINDLLHLASHGGHPDFQLSVVGMAEAPPATNPLGIEPCQLKNLFELLGRTTDGSGCGPGFVTMGPWPHP